MDRISEAEREPAAVAEGVYLADLAAGERTSMKHWRIEPGATLPTHRHDNEQIGYVISGALVARVGEGTDAEEYRLEPGDSYVLPSDERHGAENRGDEPATGVGILSPPRGDPDWKQSTSARAEAQSPDGTSAESDD
ncbi:cupin domain-containing protein [Halobacteriales archaeon QS_8_65_32]|nr:MAG: cupin domain-containing protein [Halobacteriales archaeon QS_8_65_32]